MKRLLLHIVCLVALCLVATTGLAQPESGRFRFEHITVNEGLAHSDGMCIEQDKSGFIWMGTNDGINRYDGYELKKYLLPINNRNGLFSNRIQDMYCDAKDRLWVGTESAGLSLFDADHDRFVNISQRVRPSANKALVERLQMIDVLSITSDKLGRIWVGSSRHGVFVLTLDSDNQLTHIEQLVLAGHAGPDYYISDVVVDRGGTVWIGTYGVGLWFVSPANLAAQPLVAQPAPLADRVVSALHLDRRNDLWIGTDNQIFWVSQQHRRTRQPFNTYSLGYSIQGLECIHLDSYGRLWVGTNYGLHLWEPQRATSPVSPMPVLTGKPTTYLPLDDDPFSINSGRIHQLFEDKNQILWLAVSAGGINKVNLRYKPFANLQRQYAQHPTLTNNFANAIYKDEARNWLWIGTRNGFSRYDLTTKTYRNYENRQLPGDATGIDISAFCRASDGTLWVGTRYHGLIRLREDKLVTTTQLSPQLRLSSTMLESIVEDRFGTIWVTSLDLGLLRFDKDGKLLQRFHTGNSPVPTNQFSFLCLDTDKDLLWASTRNAGVLKFRVTATSLSLLKQFSYNAGDTTSLSNNYAWPLLKDRRGTLWIGTIGGGLNQVTTDAQGKEVIRRFDKKLPVTNVETILEDDQGHLWIGGAGLTRFNPATGQSVQYLVADGLQSNSFKVGSAYKSTDGTLYFGGIKGVTYFQPRDIQPNPYAPLVRLTGLRIFNKPVLADEPVNGNVLLTKRIDKTTDLLLSASENDFSIDFVGLNYANPQKHKYAYRLIGYNNSWIMPAPGQRTASFANLPAGDYTFVVKADNGEGKWSLQPATLHITVLPPWYRSWWAYLLYVSLGAGGLFVYRRIELAQQKLKNTLALEKFQAEKEKEVTDLKLRFFTNVSHELRTPLTLILGPMEELASAKNTFHGVKDKIMLMHQQTRKLLDLVNQLMEFRKVESGHVMLRASRGNVINFITEIFLIFRLKADELQMDYALDAPETTIMMYFDRSKLEIILTNLLSNALKYTPGKGKIRLMVSIVGSPDEPAVFHGNTLHDNYLQVTVRDWGIGMNADELDQIFNPYFQASHTETLRIMGTGIGLSLVKQFAEAHAGEITVQSTPGAGTTFMLRLPFGQGHLATTDILDDVPAPERLPQAMPETVGAEAGTLLPISGSTRILVVEDNDELRQYLQQLFEPAFEVFVATDGIDGWEKSLSLMPNLVVSDVMMPRSDGLELCRKIKQHPKTMHIPVVLLTARVAVVHELEGLETGADEYLAKPFNPRILYAKIAMMLQSRHQLKEYYQRQILLEPTDVVIPDQEKQLLERAMAIVEANLSDPEFNVPTLVREMGMSQSSFYRQVKAITGQTVVEFIRDIRMKRAAQLLTSGTLRVSEVATLVGMEDVKHFRKTFQNVYSLSPSDYTKQQQELSV
ncbi:hybrid sensor histidine kinase/response regulator transcription factor [Fibrella forsythiae]|uniref:histidine kinase n=1 Tax=Fibrella forsythiae TaxID=2817061 RepID=A0ABS3JQ81_9BACT|nr:hybrid sensor histidine kinase/response regulator transcription factor [Fibrella forsythiae]MBO0952163.1 response regulator [Fibrella forsythiae]